MFRHLEPISSQFIGSLMAKFYYRFTARKISTHQGLDKFWHVYGMQQFWRLMLKASQGNDTAQNKKNLSNFCDFLFMSLYNKFVFILFTPSKIVYWILWPSNDLESTSCAGFILFIHICLKVNVTLLDSPRMDTKLL